MFNACTKPRGIVTNTPTERPTEEEGGWERRRRRKRVGKLTRDLTLIARETEVMAKVCGMSFTTWGGGMMKPCPRRKPSKRGTQA